MRPSHSDFPRLSLAPLGLAGSLTWAVLAGPAGAAQSPPSLESFAARLAADCAAGRFSGVVVAARRGEVVFQHVCGRADFETGAPMTPEAAFKIFSVSKPITGVLVTALAERGVIGLDEPVRKYVPAAPAAWEAVTVRHLLNQTAGVPELTNDLLAAYQAGARSHPEAMNRVLKALTPEKATLAAPPGTAWRYSNFGYELLAQAASAAAKRPWHELLESWVFRPCGMTTAAVELPAGPPGGPLAGTRAPGLVQGYVGAPGALKRAVSYSFVQQGAGAVHATTRDLLAFDACLKRAPLLSPQSQLRNERESVRVSDTARSGFGWLIRTAGARTYWQHDGGNNGYTSDFARTREGDATVVILTNLGFVHVPELRRDLMSALLAEE